MTNPEIDAVIAGPSARGGPSAHGASLGAALAAIADKGAEFAKLPPRCGCCAFRLGSMPNQCAATVSDALSCIAGDGGDFMCHHALGPEGAPTRPCAGFQAALAAPYEIVKQQLASALATMPHDELNDPVRQDYIDWLKIVDPADSLDDYQRAALFAQRDLTNQPETK